MKHTKTYLSGCTWCNATGFVMEPDPQLTGDFHKVCPVCKGEKAILVTETIEDDWLESVKEIIPKSIF